MFVVDTNVLAYAENTAAPNTFVHEAFGLRTPSKPFSVRLLLRNLVSMPFICRKENNLLEQHAFGLIDDVLDKPANILDAHCF